MKQKKYKSYDVFLSHSAKDKEFVSQLAKDLMKAGYRVWLDEWNIKAGDSIAKAITTGLEDSRFLLIVMSPDYFQSSWTQQEWQYALAKEMGDGDGDIKLIPLLYRDCEVPAVLRNIQWIDFLEPARYKTNLNHLMRALLDSSSLEFVESAPSETPKPGERLEAISPAELSELKTILEEATRALRAKPEMVSANPAEIDESEEDLCFIVMPFSIESLNIVYEDFVKPVLTDKCHLRTQRGDDVFGSNVIMEDITKSIRKSRLIIADLTERNPNVFYEVGIAHALNKQVLLMTQSIEDVPFDLRHRRALVYEYSPRGCKKLETDLYENVQNMLEHPKKV